MKPLHPSALIEACARAAYELERIRDAPTEPATPWGRVSHDVQDRYRTLARQVQLGEEQRPKDPVGALRYDAVLLMSEALGAAPRHRARSPVKTIAEMVATHYHLPSKSIFSRDRSRSVVFARMVVAYLCRVRTSMSYVEISRALSRDNSIVLRSSRKAEKLLKSDASFRRGIDAICTKLDDQEERATEDRVAPGG